MIIWPRSYCLGPVERESASSSKITGERGSHRRYGDRRNAETLADQLRGFTDHVYYIASSRMSGGSYRRKLSVSSLRPRSSKSVPDHGGNESSSRCAHRNNDYTTRRKTDWILALGYRRHRTIPIRFSLILSRRRGRYPRLRLDLACLVPQPTTLYQRCPSPRVPEPQRPACRKQARPHRSAYRY